MSAPPRAEGCGLVPVASSMRNMDARYYSPAQCVGQLAENSAAKGSQFNATTFQVSVLPEFDSFLRTGDLATKVPTQALKALDDGVGFLYEEVQDMMTYGTPESLCANKKFGSIWHTLLAFGSNFDEGLYSFRKLSWPATFTGTSLLQLAEEDFFQCGSKAAFQDMFRTDGKPWANLKDLTAAHSYFKEIEDTGVLGIFPFGLQADDLQVKVEEADIMLQGVSLKELLGKYFVSEKLGLLPADYWTGYRGFKMVLMINRRKKIEIYPRAPKFEVSKPLTVRIGQAEHRLVYGPFKSDKHQHSLFPYAAKAGNTFYNQGYDLFLASNSRVMNPLYQPKTSDNRDARADYFNKQRSQNQKSAGALQSLQLEEMCGVKLPDVPEQFEELKDLLNDLRVFDGKNPYLKKSEEYQKQMKNLKWLLGLPFEITVQIDTEHLHFNDAKDDLKDDALKRDAFFASVHTVVALDVCQRMQNGFKRLTHDIDEQKPDNQAKINTLFKPGKVSGAATSTPAKRAPAKRGPKKAVPAERAQQTEQAQHAQQPQRAEQAQQSEEAEHAQQPASDRDAAAAVRETDAWAMPADNGSLSEQGSLSARAARHLSRIHQQPPTELPSPSETRAGKRRRSAMPADDPDLLPSVLEDAMPIGQLARVSQRVTVSRGVLDCSRAEPASKQRRLAHVSTFKELWQQAVADELIVHCPRTQDIRDLALQQFEQ